jgi:hypothetical protein
MAFLAAAVTVTMLSAVSPASSFLTSSRTSRFLSSVRSQFADADTASTDLSFRWKQVDTDYCLVPQGQISKGYRAKNNKQTRDANIFFVEQTPLYPVLQRRKL